MGYEYSIELSLQQLSLIAVPKPLLTEFGIHHRLENWVLPKDNQENLNSTMNLSQ